MSVTLIFMAVLQDWEAKEWVLSFMVALVSSQPVLLPLVSLQLAGGDPGQHAHDQGSLLGHSQ